MKKRFLIFFLAVGAFFFVPEVLAKDYVIRMLTHSESGQYAFEPQNLTIKSGDTVTWINAQDDTHNVMAGSVPEGAESFSSPMLEKNGQEWSYTFTKPGTYSFHCHPHAALGMKGEIVVDHPSENNNATPGEHEHGMHDHRGKEGGK